MSLVRTAKAFVALPVAIIVSLVAFSAQVGATEIELTTGEKISGMVVEETEQLTVVDHPTFGRLQIPAALIKVEVEDPIAAGLFDSWILRGYTRKVSAGFSGSNGNSDDISFNAGLDLGRATDGYRSQFVAGYFYTETEDVKSRNEFFGNYQHDFLLPKKTFIFVKARYDFDEFQAWKSRIAGSTGAGYDIIAKEMVSLRANAGFGVSRTFGSVRETSPEAIAGVLFTWQITDAQLFEADTVYNLDLNEAPDFRLLSNAAYTIGVGGIEGLSLKFGVKNEYISAPNGADKKNNLKYYGNLVYDF